LQIANGRNLADNDVIGWLLAKDILDDALDIVSDRNINLEILQMDLELVSSEGFKEPCCSIGATPGPLVLMPPAISISRAEPPGLMLNAMAERLITTPLTSDGPVPPNVSMPRRPAGRWAG
jgi:hypothetical protein